MLKTFLYALACTTAAASLASADALLVGLNTQTPLQVYSLGGVYEQDFGPTGASAGIEQNGLLYVAQPNTSGPTTTSISALNSAQQVVSSFTFSDLISDGAPGPNGTLWLSGYDGMVYNVSTTGTVLSSFNTGYTNIGIASNGSTLYTTEGGTSDGIDIRNSSGAIQSTVHTGLTSLYGIAYDSGNSSLFAGTFNYVYDLSLSGSIITTLNLPGASPAYPTPNGANHDGLELVDLSSLQSPPPPPTVPEPRLGWITGLLIALFIGGRWLRGRFVRKLKVVPAFLLAFNAFGSVNVTLNHSAMTVPVGSSITFTANASDTSNPAATFTYQFSVAPSGSSSYSIVKDYYTTNSLTWAETAAEGVYDVQVKVQSSTGASGSAIEPVTFTSRVTGTSPVVSATQNPLVALYSAPVCTAGKTIRVRFRTQSATTWQATPTKTCNGSTSMNFLIAGMLARTEYLVQHDLYNGPFDTPGPVLTFTTGSVAVSLPSTSTLAGPATPTSISYPFILEARGVYPAVNDLNGNTVWYLAAMNNPAESGSVLRNTNAGTVLTIMDDPHKVPTVNHEFFREFDLAGNLVRETNWNIAQQSINTLRASKGQSAAHAVGFSHEAFRMPNGDTITFMSDERIANQGQGDVDVFGDLIVVLDTNFQPVWTWSTFDHLPITRKALLNDTCAPGNPGCQPITNKMPNGQLYTVANDWTHMNSVVLDPSDGNFIASIRHQAWVIKVAYENGAGDGHLVWTLGNDGSFSLPSGTPTTAWFSYQHCAQIWPNGQLTLFDNGNYRISQNNGVGDSRGQSWTLNTTTMVATPIVNYDLGAFSAAVGYSALLSNGNYDYSAGFLNGGTETQTSECRPGGSTSSCLVGNSGLAYKEQVNGFTYRAIRLPDMYTQR